MIGWIDAQLSPTLASWIEARFSVETRHLMEMALIEATDPAIFRSARQPGTVVMTKDRDFVDLVRRLGPPPQVLWITSGNTSNRRMKQILEGAFEDALRLLEAGEALVEIRD